MVFKTGKEELVWTEQPEVGEPVRSRWVRLESSEQFDRVQVETGCKERLKNFLKQNRLPEFVFPVPRYGPLVHCWRDQQPLRRQVAGCERWEIKIIQIEQWIIWQLTRTKHLRFGIILNFHSVPGLSCYIILLWPNKSICLSKNLLLRTLSCLGSCWLH